MTDTTKETTQATVEKTVTGKTTWSPGSPTPMWATWVFRIFFNVTLAAFIWIGSTGTIADDHKVELMLVLKVLDNLIWGIGKGLGVKKEQFNEQ